MNTKYITKISLAVVVALAVSIQVGSAATVVFPDLSAGGTFTLNAGDDTTLTATASIADNAQATLNINGTWNSGGFEVQLGGVNGQFDGTGLNSDLNQDVTLNIGSTGVVNWTATWFAAGWPGNATDPLSPGTVMNFEVGGVLNLDGTGFGVRSKGTSIGGNANFSASGTGGGGGQQADTLFQYLYDGGLLQINGGNVGTFASNFTITGDPTGAYSLTAVPEPSTFMLLVLGVAGLAFTRRRK